MGRGGEGNVRERESGEGKGECVRECVFLCKGERDCVCERERMHSSILCLITRFYVIVQTFFFI